MHSASKGFVELAGGNAHGQDLVAHVLPQHNSHVDGSRSHRHGRSCAELLSPPHRRLNGLGHSSVEGSDLDGEVHQDLICERLLGLSPGPTGLLGLLLRPAAAHCQNGTWNSAE